MNRNVLFIPIGILAIGILPLPIGYYTLVRIVVFITMGYLAWKYFEAKDNTLVWIFGFFAALYNPLIPVYLESKILWIAFNIATITALIYQYRRAEEIKPIDPVIAADLGESDGILLRNFLFGLGWKKEWLNESQTIGYIDTTMLGAFLEQRSGSIYFYSPFYKKDRKRNRRLYHRDIFQHGVTDLRFSTRLKGMPAFERNFETGHRHPEFFSGSSTEFVYGEWYTFILPPGKTRGDPFLLTDGLNLVQGSSKKASVFMLGLGALSFIDSIDIRLGTL